MEESSRIVGVLRLVPPGGGLLPGLDPTGRGRRPRAPRRRRRSRAGESCSATRMAHSSDGPGSSRATLPARRGGDVGSAARARRPAGVPITRSRSSSRCTAGRSSPSAPRASTARRSSGCAASRASPLRPGARSRRADRRARGPCCRAPCARRTGLDARRLSTGKPGRRRRARRRRAGLGDGRAGETRRGTSGSRRCRRGGDGGPTTSCSSATARAAARRSPPVALRWWRCVGYAMVVSFLALRAASGWGRAARVGAASSTGSSAAQAEWEAAR